VFWAAGCVRVDVKLRYSFIITVLIVTVTLRTTSKLSFIVASKLSWLLTKTRLSWLLLPLLPESLSRLFRT
jgi:hypothetical protein